MQIQKINLQKYVKTSMAIEKEQELKKI